MTDAERGELTATELDIVAGGSAPLENTLISAGRLTVPVVAGRSLLETMADDSTNI
jgi:hypothetical protein